VKGIVGLFRPGVKQRQGSGRVVYRCLTGRGRAPRIAIQAPSGEGSEAARSDWRSSATGGCETALP
jgi:hypothetical protein